MSEKIYKAYSSELTDIADAIRAKTGGTEELEFPNEFASEISRISGGGTVPTKTSELENDSGFISSEQTQHIYGQASEPLAAEEGDIWIDTDDDSSIITNVSVFTQTTAPTDANQGDLWIDTSSDVGDGVYLPLGAGVNNPLSGILYMNNTQSSSNVIATAYAIDNGVYFEGSYNNTIQGGLSTVNDGRAIVYGNGNAVMLRPNGRGNASGQVYVSSDGTINTAGNIQLTNSNPLIQNNAGTAGLRMYESSNSVLWATNTHIYLRTRGYNSTVSQYGFLDGGLIRVDATSSSYAGLERRNEGASAANSYIHFTVGGYCDIWSTQVTQIRCGAGNEESTTVNFMFNTNGVLRAPGMYTTTRSGSTLVIDSSGNIGRTSSLRKYKKNILPITDEDAIKGFNLNPITYTSALEYDLQNTQYGLIAEEVEEVLPNLCTYDTEGNIDGVAYDRVCTILLKQNQMLKSELDELKEQVRLLK